MAVQQITDHPKLKYLDRPIKRYLQRIDNPYFSNKPGENKIECLIEIKHYGVEADNSETYLGNSLCKDIVTTLVGSNENQIDPTTQNRVAIIPEQIIPAVYDVDGVTIITPEQIAAAHYPTGTMAEYDYWIYAVKNLPTGVTMFDLLKQQMMLFANRGDFDIYPL